MKSFIRILFLLFIITGFLLLGYDKVNSFKILKINDKKVEDFFYTKNINISKKNTTNGNYIGVLEIPKIRLKKGFVDPFSIHNNIGENITILKPYMMPNERNSTFLLAAHSGNSNISFFKDLYKLSIGDTIYIYYGNKKYIYEVVKYYEEDKKGTITINDNNNIKKLVLTTCKSFNKQLIYIAHLKEVKNELL